MGDFEKKKTPGGKLPVGMFAENLHYDFSSKSHQKIYNFCSIE